MKTLLRSALIAVLAMAAAVPSAIAVAAQAVRDGAHAIGEKFDQVVFGYLANSGLMLFATSYSDVYTGKLPVRNTPTDAGLLPFVVPFDLPAANPTVGDILALCKVPADVQIADWTVETEDADSDGAPTLEFTLGSLNAGLTDIATTYAATVAVGETGGLSRAATSVAFAESSAAERSIGLKWTTAAATYVTGKKGLLVLWLRG